MFTHENTPVHGIFFFFFSGPQIKSAKVDIQTPLDASSIR